MKLDNDVTWAAIRQRLIQQYHAEERVLKKKKKNFPKTWHEQEMGEQFLS